MTESKKIQNQLNFFSDSITKGISHRRNDKSIYNNNNINKDKKDDEDKKTISDFGNNDNDEDQINILTKDQFFEMKKKTDKKEDNQRNENILEESDELKDSYCDNILKNMEKYRGDMQNDD